MLHRTALVTVLALLAGSCVDADPIDAVEQSASLEDYNQYPTDRQSYQLELRGLLTPQRLAAFELVARAFEEHLPGFTLQSFKTFPSYEYSFLFKATSPSSGSYRCVKIKVMVDTSPTDAYPRITRVKELARVTATELCRDGTEI